MHKLSHALIDNRNTDRTKSIRQLKKKVKIDRVILDLYNYLKQYLIEG